MTADLIVLGQDPRFGGGSAAQTTAFLDGAKALGRHPELLYDEHPGLGGRRVTWRRVEALRQLAAARRLASRARTAQALWVVATLAQHGAAALRSQRPYACWIGTTIRSEWAGRAAGMPHLRRAAGAVSVPTLISLERRVLRGAARLYATSPASRAEIARVAGVEEQSIGIIPIPIDLETFSPADDEDWREAAARPVLVFVGRADDPRKNVPMLLEAFVAVRRHFPHAVLRLVGRPPLGRVPDGVEAVGEVGNVSAELRRSGVFVLSSQQEGFGIAVAEAMAVGLPVVTSPSGGPVDLIQTSGAGVVARDHSAQSLAQAIESVLAESARLDEMRRLGRAHVVQEHSPPAFRQHLRSAFDDVEVA